MFPVTFEPARYTRSHDALGGFGSGCHNLLDHPVTFEPQLNLGQILEKPAVPAQMSPRTFWVPAAFGSHASSPVLMTTATTTPALSAGAMPNRTSCSLAFSAVPVLPATHAVDLRGGAGALLFASTTPAEDIADALCGVDADGCASFSGCAVKLRWPLALYTPSTRSSTPSLARWRFPPWPSAARWRPAGQRWAFMVHGVRGSPAAAQAVSRSVISLRVGHKATCT